MTAEIPHPHIKRHYSPVDKIDRYLRREDTPFAKLARKIAPTGRAYSESWQKRWLVDVPIGIVGTGLYCVTFPVLGAAIWRGDHGPVFYRQERIGKDGKQIFVKKYRTMHRDADGYSQEEIQRINLEIGPVDDPRNTRVGRHLRRFDLDELPQLFQVLTGDLSASGIRVMNKAFRDSMAQSINNVDMSRWDSVYAQNAGIFNIPAILMRGKKNDKTRVHGDLLYQKKASLGLDYYLPIMTTLRTIEKAAIWLESRSYAPVREVVIEDKTIKVTSASKKEWAFAKNSIHELSLDRDLIEALRNEGKGGHMLDIGASVGIYSALALQNGLSVTAIEPDVDCQRSLEATMSLNCLRGRQMQILQAALSDQSGTGELHFEPDFAKCPSLKRTLDQSRSRDVQLYALDDLIESGSIATPTIIKIDVEGAEMQVLKGGDRYFSSADAADVFIEIHPEFLPLFDSSSDEVIQTLTEKFGYTCVSTMHKQKEILMHFSKK